MKKKILIVIIIGALGLTLYNFKKDKPPVRIKLKGTYETVKTEDGTEQKVFVPTPPDPKTIKKIDTPEKRQKLTDDIEKLNEDTKKLPTYEQ